MRCLPVKTEASQEKTKVFSFQEAITIFGGITGLVVAILWQAGRFYVNGYFSAMNIPIFQINFSVWEYAEVSWFRLFVYFISKLSLPLLVISSGGAVSILVALILQRVFPRLKIEKGIQKIRGLFEEIWRQSKAVFGISFIILLVYFLTLSFQDLQRSGEKAGKQVVLYQSHSVEVYSPEELSLGSASVVPDTTPLLFHYNGLKLLTYNNGKYYLFREVNSETCKPEQVFIVENSENIHIVLGEITPVDGPCSTASTETNPPVLTP